MAGDARPGSPPAQGPRVPTVRALQCPKCGGTLAVRGLQKTTTIVCTSCSSIVDISSDDLRILSTFAANVTREPQIPLGTRGTLRGDPYEIIGFVCRAITVDDTDYEWREYLLFNPYKGFRWLTEYNGHWNDVKTANGQPEEATGTSATYLGTRFWHFQTAEARVVYVLGEFYWQVQVGEKARVSDYVMPPLMLSKEETQGEVTWSIGEYMQPEAVWRAFGLKTAVPGAIGVFANQPSPYSAKSKFLWRASCALAALALVIQVAASAVAENRLVFERDYTFVQADAGKADVTPPFDLGGHTSNVVIRTTTDLENQWIYLSYALISLDDGRAWDFGREVSYYHGVEGGESWSEGSRTDEAVLPAVPPGQYYLRIEPETTDASVRYHVQVHRDVPTYWFLFVALGALAIYPVVFWLKTRSFETARWSESDHAPASSDSSDDSD